MPANYFGVAQEIAHCAQNPIFVWIILLKSQFCPVRAGLLVHNPLRPNQLKANGEIWPMS